MQYLLHKKKKTVQKNKKIICTHPTHNTYLMKHSSKCYINIQLRLFLSHVYKVTV